MGDRQRSDFHHKADAARDAHIAAGSPQQQVAGEALMHLCLKKVLLVDESSSSSSTHTCRNNQLSDCQHGNECRPSVRALHVVANAMATSSDVHRLRYWAFALLCMHLNVATHFPDASTAPAGPYAPCPSPRLLYIYFFMDVELWMRLAPQVTLM
jgi:hypothetical protein